MEVVYSIIERVRATPQCRRIEFQARQSTGYAVSLSHPYRWWLLPVLFGVYVFLRLYSVTEEVLSQGSMILLNFPRLPLTVEQIGSVNIMGGIILLVIFCGAGFFAFVHFLPKLREHIIEAHFSTPLMQAVFKHFVQQALELSVFMFTVRQALVLLMAVALPPLVSCPDSLASLGWWRFHAERTLVLLLYATASLVMYGINVRLLMLPTDRVGNVVMKCVARGFLYMSVAMLRIYPALNAAGYPLPAVLLHLSMRYPFVLLALGFLSIEPVDALGAAIRREYDVTFFSMLLISGFALAATSWSTVVGFDIANEFIKQGLAEPWPDLFLFVSLGVRLLILLLCVAVLCLYVIGLHAVYGGMPLLACEFSQPRVTAVRFKHGASIVPKLQRMYANYLEHYVNTVLQDVFAPTTASAESAARGSGFTLASLGAAVGRTTSGGASAAPMMMMAAAVADDDDTAGEDPPEAEGAGMQQTGAERATGLPRATSAASPTPAVSPERNTLLQGMRDIIELTLSVRSMLSGRPFSVELEGHVRVVNTERHPMIMTPATITVEACMAPIAHNYFDTFVQAAPLRRVVVVAMRGFTVPPAGHDGPFEGDVPVAITVFLHFDTVYGLLQCLQAGWSMHSLYAGLRVSSRILKGFAFSVPLLSWLNRSWTGIGMLDPKHRPSQGKSLREWNARLTRVTEDLAQRRVHALLAELKKLPERVHPTMYRLLLLLVHMNRRSNTAGKAAAAAFETFDEGGLQQAERAIADRQHAEALRAAAVVADGDVVPAGASEYDHDPSYLLDEMEATFVSDMMDVLIALQLIIDIRLEVGEHAGMSPLLVETTVTLLNYFYNRVTASFQAGASPVQLLLFTGIMTGFQGIMLPSSVAALMNNPPLRPSVSQDSSQDPPQRPVHDVPPAPEAPIDEEAGYSDESSSFFITQGRQLRPQAATVPAFASAVSADPAPVAARMSPVCAAPSPEPTQEVPPEQAAWRTPPCLTSHGAPAYNPFDSPSLRSMPAAPRAGDLFTNLLQMATRPVGTAVASYTSADGLRHRFGGSSITNDAAAASYSMDDDDVAMFTSSTPPRPPPFAPAPGSPARSSGMFLHNAPQMWAGSPASHKS